MNKVHFTPDGGTHFYKELHHRVNEYFIQNGIAKDGGNVLRFKIFLYFSLDVLFFTLMITANTTAMFYLWYLLMGLSVLLTAFNISHDASHGVAVKSKMWNKLLFSLSFNLQGNNAYVWGKNHSESHHLYTNIEGSDIDVLNNPLVRMSESQQLKWFHRYQFLYGPLLSLLYSLNWFFIRELLMVFGFTSRTIEVKIPPKEVLTLVFFKILYLTYMILLPALFLDVGLGHILLAFVLNHFMVSAIFVGVLGVSHVSDYVQHPFTDNNNRLNMSWPTLQMVTSVDYNAESKFCSWTLGGFNAHAVHHLLPHISHVHYVNLLPIFKEVVTKHNMVYMNMPYRKALAGHFRFLYKMGRTQTLKPISYESQAY